MPSPETVLNKPLSGMEVRKIILGNLERTLAGDTRLADYVAFPSFEYKLDLAIILTGAVNNKIDKVLTGKGGEVPADPEAEQTAVLLHNEQKPMSPNEARIEAGLGVPVLSRDEKGREIEKEIKYSKEALHRKAGPRG